MKASFNQITTPAGYVFTPKNEAARVLCQRIECSEVRAGTLAVWAAKHEIRIFKRIEIEITN